MTQSSIEKENNMFKQITSFLKDEEGASAVEYGLIVGLIAVAVVTIMITMGGDLETLFTAASDQIGTAADAVPGSGD